MWKGSGRLGRFPTGGLASPESGHGAGNDTDGKKCEIHQSGGLSHFLLQYWRQAEVYRAAVVHAHGDKQQQDRHEEYGFHDLNEIHNIFTWALRRFAVLPRETITAACLPAGIVGRPHPSTKNLRLGIEIGPLHKNNGLWLGP